MTTNLIKEATKMAEEETLLRFDQRLLKNVIELYNIYDEKEYLYQAQSLALRMGEDKIFEQLTLEVFSRGFIETINSKRSYIAELMEKQAVATSKEDNDDEINYLNMLLDHYANEYLRLQDDFKFWQLNGPHNLFNTTTGNTGNK